MVLPFFANKGFDPLGNFVPKTVPYAQPVAERTVLNHSELHEHLRTEIVKAQEASAIQFGKHRLPVPLYDIGDKIWLSSRHIKITRPTKRLDHCYLGPFKVKEKILTHAYCLSLPKDMPIHDVFHV